jgi:hypothetical protein
VERLATAVWDQDGLKGQRDALKESANLKAMVTASQKEAAAAAAASAVIATRITLAPILNVV